MSYEGIDQVICTKGHYFEVEASYYGGVWACPRCKEEANWYHPVDQTNGYDEDDPNTYRAEVEEIGFEDDWKEDHYGNKYAVRIPLVKPKSDQWRPVNEPAEETETAKPAEPIVVHPGVTLEFEPPKEAETPPTNYWTYQIVRSTDPEGEDSFEVNEVYYLDGKPSMYGSSLVSSESLDGLKEVLERMQTALTKPVLDDDNWPNEWNPKS